MQTIGEHIKQLFGGFNIPLNEAAVLEIAQRGINPNERYTSEVHEKMMLAVLDFAPLLMLSPASYSVSENGHSKSVSFNADGFMRWYSLLCKKYGVKNELDTERPRIKFL